MWASDDFSVDDRDKRLAAATITGVGKAEALGQTQGVTVAAPSGGSVGVGPDRQQFTEAFFGLLDLCLAPGVVSIQDALFPGDAVPGVDAGFKACFMRLAEDVAATFANVRRWQQASVKPGFESVKTFQRIGGVLPPTAVGAEGEKEAALRFVFLEQGGQCRDAGQRPKAGVSVDLECDSFHSGIQEEGEKRGSASSAAASVEQQCGSDLAAFV